MTKLAELVGHELKWIQPHALKMEYELHTGDIVVATLRFRSSFGSFATATSADGSWTFKRVGFFNPRVTVRSEGSETDLAVFRPKWTGSEGTTQLANGAAYTWKTANFWATEYAWQNSAGEPLILYKQGVEASWLADLFKTQARVEIQPSAQGLQDLALLVLLGWYLIVLKQQDDASIAVTAVG